jgi:glucan biosynthesis protein C
MNMTTTTAITQPGLRTRLHGLDALRAGALLLGIVLHSLMPFLPGGIWMVNDRYSSTWALVGTYLIHLFRMPLFLLLAGYFARMSLLRKGTRPFLVDRLKRIGLPLIAFWPIAVLPLAVLTVINYSVRDLTPPPIPPEAAQAMITPGQLWFLLVLIECYLIMLAVRAVARKVLGDQRCTAIAERAAGVLTSPAGLLLAMLPYAVAVVLQGEPVTGGIREPMTFVPEPRGLVAYFGAFLVGWCFHARSDALTRVAGSRWPYLAIAVGMSVIGWFVIDSAVVPSPVVALVVAIAGWSWIYALLGLAVRHLNRERPAVRYLADASYWMYLLHLPLLLALEIPLADLALPIIVKLLITWAASFVILVLSYHVLVRSTWIGRWLNGRKHPWSWPPLRPVVDGRP